MSRSLLCTRFPLKLVQILLAVSLCFVFANGANASTHWANLAESIVVSVQAAQNAHQKGDTQGAKRAVVEAYFGIFEGAKMEAAMRITRGAKYTYKVERLFGKLRKLVASDASKDEISDLATSLIEVIRQDAHLLDAAEIPPEVFKVNQ